ncbi:Dephospho-CoA kinase [Candidatus Ecksteinia adelgidicola]|nr:Dephospho-CoA kinase [Candidatus Ecksteinia adelgidicola]
MIMTYIVAITGGIGSGKSTVTNYFSRYGITIIDSDLIARKIVSLGQPVLTKIAKHFGDKVLLKCGRLNRVMIRKKIFSDNASKIYLNKLLHPLIHQEIKRQFTLSKTSYTLWVVPLLIENNLHNFANRVLVVDITMKDQLDRIVKRDHISYQEAKNICLSQVTRDKRLSIADDIIDNSGNILKLDLLVSDLHQYYLQLAD